MGSITGAIAAAYYKKIPDYLMEFALRKLPADILDVVSEFNYVFNS